jgi:hypothetical protein
MNRLWIDGDFIRFDFTQFNDNLTNQGMNFANFQINYSQLLIEKYEQKNHANLLFDSNQFHFLLSRKMD